MIRRLPSLPVTCLLLLVLLGLCGSLLRADERAHPRVLSGTKPLTLEEPLDEAMVAGIDKFAMRALAESRQRRASDWKRDYCSQAAYVRSVADNRERFRAMIGAVDPRVTDPRFEVVSTLDHPGSISAQSPQKLPGHTPASGDAAFSARFVRWPVLKGVTAEGLLLTPAEAPSARVIALPDADWTPEEFVGLAIEGGDKPNSPSNARRLSLQLAAQGCQVVIPMPINREERYSGHPDVFFTNAPHREWIYRLSFEMGRHIIGYEVQKVRAAVDAFELLDDHRSRGAVQQPSNLPVGVVGVGEGGLIALYAAALDTRIDAAMVCGYFDQRENVWQEPIYRNLFGLLTEFGDAQIASLIAPRSLVIEASASPEVAGPPPTRDGRRAVAAPGFVKTPDVESVRIEFERAKAFFEKLGIPEKIALAVSADGTGPAGNDAALQAFLKEMGIERRPNRDVARLEVDASLRKLPLFDSESRQRRQFDELAAFSQSLLETSARKRDEFWSEADRSSLESWRKTAQQYRDHVHEEMIGRLPEPTLPPNPRSRKIFEKEGYVGYEVTIDVYPDIFAGGILLLPEDLQPHEKRPLVVCQHGLEGTPNDTITTDEQSPAYRAYKGFSTQLVKRGFIVYAPQNPYRGGDRFRVLQRKSNPLKRSLYSYIIPQHQQTLKWLATLPSVDAERIAFYGLSYGGKTAMRVPPFLLPGENRPGYCLAICSADFNEWIRKNVSNKSRYSYIFTGEYEIWEWNMGHVAGYAELASLMTPRPFMVERGHDDGVAPDEWVAWEFAKVRRHYDQLGIGEQTEIEFFNGPHTINGKGTFEFLHRHLNWPEPEAGQGNP